jgi:hypothetical protein
VRLRRLARAALLLLLLFSFPRLFSLSALFSPRLSAQACVHLPRFLRGDGKSGGGDGACERQEMEGVWEVFARDEEDEVVVAGGEKVEGEREEDNQYLRVCWRQCVEVEDKDREMVCSIVEVGRRDKESRDCEEEKVRNKKMWNLLPRHHRVLGIRIGGEDGEEEESSENRDLRADRKN